MTKPPTEQNSVEANPIASPPEIERREDETVAPVSRRWGPAGWFRLALLGMAALIAILYVGRMVS